MAAGLAVILRSATMRTVLVRCTGLVAAIIVSCASLPVTAGDRIPASVTAALKAAGIPQSAAALVVENVDARQPQLAVNAERPMNPASVMKLLTTYAALDLLGPAYTWKTEASATAWPVDGRLAGDLYLKGSGDPKFTLEQFWLLLRQLRARGVREISGDLVVDNNAFDVRNETPAPFDDKPLRPYNVTPDALLLNFKTLQLTLVPDSVRNKVDALPEPRLDNLEIVNQIRLEGTECGEWKDTLQAEFVGAPPFDGDTRTGAGRSANRAEGGAPTMPQYPRLTLSGSYAVDCGEKGWNLAVLSHTEYIDAVFRQLWQELGGEFHGVVRQGTAPIEGRLLAVSESPSLSEIVRDINKVSNNVMARQLYLTLGVDVHRRAASPADAEAVIRTWLAVKGINIPELVLENGAGLSRRERISAFSLAKLLQSAWSSPLMPELMASMPLVAVDGTMKKRLKDRSVGGQAHIKTGSLDEVKTMAGYVRDKSGHYKIVVFLINHPKAEAGQAAQDALLEWVYEAR